jgi:putative ATPase
VLKCYKQNNGKSLSMSDLLSQARNTTAAQPLAARQRPQTLESYVGQSHLLAPGKALREVIEKGICIP